MQRDLVVKNSELEQYLVILGENQPDKRGLEMINQTERCYIKVGFDEWLPSGI